MNSLKKLSMVATVLGLGATSSFAEIKLTDNLGVSGFLDMSVSGSKAEDVDATLGASLDQFELDFMYKFGDKISARADINALPNAVGAAPDTVPSPQVTLEQGFVTYATGGFALSAGRFLSSSGFEAAEPTGLYQYSTSKTLVYGGYQNGVSAAYTTPMFGLYGAVVTDLWTSNETELMNSPGFEGQISLTPAEGVTAKATYLYQMYDDAAAATLGDESQQLLNVWASYANGPLTVAAEYNMLIDWVVGAANDETGHGYLAMVNYKLSDMVAATVRYSGIILGDLDPDTEITFSPSVALSANWLALAEVKYQIDAKQTDYAVETLFSF